MPHGDRAAGRESTSDRSPWTGALTVFVSRRGSGSECAKSLQPSAAWPEPQHFLNLRPLPQGQGALRPTLVVRAGRREASSATTISSSRSSGSPSPPKVIVALSRTAARSPASTRSTVRRTLIPDFAALTRLASSANSSACVPRPVSSYRWASRCRDVLFVPHAGCRVPAA